APVLDLTAVPGGEFLEVGMAEGISLLVPVPVVQGLNAASRWGVIPGNGDLELGAIGEFEGALYQAFPKTSGPYDHGTVQILEAARNDFTGRGAPAVHEYRQWDFQVLGPVGGPVLPVELFDIGFGGDDQFSLFDEQIGHIDGLRKQSPGIAPEVQDQALRPLPLEVPHGGPGLI